jgi:hypothetical protein
MRVFSKSSVLRWLLAVALCPAALSGGGRDVTPEGSAGPSVVLTRADSFSASPASHQITVEESDGVLVATLQTEADITSARPICPDGEKVKCTLGPPPVCHCE